MTEDEINFRRAEFQAFNDKAVEASASAIKGALIVNGGAAVAVLGFVSALLSKGVLPPGVTDALMFFAWGVALAVGSSALSYLTHLATMLQIDAILSGRSEKISNWIKPIIHFVSIGVFLLSIAAFVAGCLSVKASIDGAV
ncbi:hypothetical protein [Leisingera daeponensis]|uniref:hypothetical protein n=1 Tax=Leisingera daeponensis TaxID=405746 RepID=UPI001C94B8A7|nr:hypothetical protein [Leisingera daeponensis]MBY6056779.1 hypothetical protein [Leisingera daeponensis]